MSEVALVDLNGQILREYWHTGHFSALKLADLDSDGRPEIYLAGISNGYKCATLVALDPDTFTGASREDPDYQLMDLPAPRETARVLFPRTVINRALLPYNVPKQIRCTAGRLSVDVAELLPGSEFPAATFFYFGPRLRLLDVGIADANYTAYQHMHAKGLLPTADPRAELPALHNVRYLTPWQR